MTREDVFSRRLHAEEDLARDHERPQIETALAARDPGAVDAHELLDRFDEHGSGTGAIAMRSAESWKRLALASGRNRFTPPSSRL